MKVTKLQIFIALITITGSNLQAQFLKNIGKSIQQKIKNKIDNKIDQKTIDKTFENSKNSTPKNNTSFNFNSLTKPAKVESRYSFDFMITSKMSSKNEDTQTFIQGYGKKAILIDNQSDSKIIIIDHENESLITLDSDKKTGTTMSLALLKQIGHSTPKKSITDYTDGIQKTGKNKSILGYKCYEYVSTDHHNHVQLWFTKQIDIDTSKNTNELASMFSNNSSITLGKQGVVMEMNVFDENKQLIHKTEITDIKTTNQKINLNTYKLTNSFKN